MERRYGPGWLRDDDDDKVPHARLMNKVRAHDVKGLVANWIENCLIFPAIQISDQCANDRVTGVLAECRVQTGR